jgi:hypothetical protein
MYTAHELFQLVHQQPFQPMRIHLVDGRVFDIPHEGLVVILAKLVHIGVTAPGGVPPGYETIETVPLASISRVEKLSTASPTRA